MVKWIVSWTFWTVLCVTSFGLNAQAMRDVKLVEVLTPSTVSVKTQHNTVVTLTLVGPLFGDIGDEPCERNGSVITQCKKLTQLLSKHDLQLIISHSNNARIFGDLMVGDRLASEVLIADGMYRFDHQYSRALYLVKAQNQARCGYKGIWMSLRGDPKVAAQCQQL